MSDVPETPTSHLFAVAVSFFLGGVLCIYMAYHWADTKYDKMGHEDRLHDIVYEYLSQATELGYLDSISIEDCSHEPVDDEFFRRTFGIKYIYFCRTEIDDNLFSVGSEYSDYGREYSGG